MRNEVSKIVDIQANKNKVKPVRCFYCKKYKNQEILNNDQNIQHKDLQNRSRKEIGESSQLNFTDNQDKYMTVNLGTRLQKAKVNIEQGNQYAGLQIMKRLNSLHQEFVGDQQKINQEFRRLNQTIDVQRQELQNLELKFQLSRTELSQGLQNLKRIKSNREQEFKLRQEILKRKMNTMTPNRLLDLLNQQWQEFQQLFKHQKNRAMKKESTEQLNIMKLSINSMAKLIQLSKDIYDNEQFDSHHKILKYPFI